MNNIESRLIEDASDLESIRVQDDDKLEFQRALAHTRQDTFAAKHSANLHRGWWLSGLVVASLAFAFLMLADEPQPHAPATPVAQQTTPLATDRLPVLRPFSEFGKFEQVSHAAALEEEWVNIQKDLAQARDTIESELPIRF